MLLTLVEKAKEEFIQAFLEIEIDDLKLEIFVNLGVLECYVFIKYVKTANY